MKKFEIPIFFLLGVYFWFLVNSKPVEVKPPEPATSPPVVTAVVAESGRLVYDEPNLKIYHEGQFRPEDGSPYVIILRVVRNGREKIVIADRMFDNTAVLEF